MKLDRKGPPQPGEASRPPGTKPPRKAQRLTESPSSSTVTAATAPPRQDVTNSDASSGTTTQSMKRPRLEASGDPGDRRRKEAKVVRGENMDAKAILAALDATQLVSVLRGLEAGVSVADLIAEARRRLAAGGRVAVGAVTAKEKKEKKEKKSKKKSKKQKKSN